MREWLIVLPLFRVLIYCRSYVKRLMKFIWSCLTSRRKFQSKHKEPSRSAVAILFLSTSPYSKSQNWQNWCFLWLAGEMGKISFICGPNICNWIQTFEHVMPCNPIWVRSSYLQRTDMRNPMLLILWRHFDEYPSHCDKALPRNCTRHFPPTFHMLLWIPDYRNADT